jgi:hypothetical protein
MLDQIAVRVSVSPIALVVALVSPVAVAMWIGTHRFSGWLSWFNAACCGLAVGLFSYLFCVWPLVGIGWRPASLIFGVLAAAVAASRTKTSSRATKRACFGMIFVTVVTIVVGAADILMLVGTKAPLTAVPAAFPFSKPGKYVVSHGGATALLNYHYGISPELRYAMDMGRLDAAGRRAAGLLPSSPRDYASYAVPVVSPVSGVVLESVDGVPDSPIGGSNPDQPGGNHVAVHDREHAIAVWLCHLKPGSVVPRRGDYVHVGDQVGQVGNSGSSSEPHLHLCAQRYVDNAFLEGVPLTFGGRFLVRNSTVAMPEP